MKDNEMLLLLYTATISATRWLFVPLETRDREMLVKMISLDV